MEKEYLFDGSYYSKNDILTMIRYYQQHHPHISQDTWYNILLNTDVNQINKSCQTNKLTSQICHNKQFWLDYWKKQGVPKSVFNLPESQKDWYKLYKITIIVNKLINLFINEHELTKEWIDVMINFYEYSDFDVTKLLPYITDEIINLDNEMKENEDLDRKIIIRLFENDDIVLQYYYEDFNGNTIDNISKEINFTILTDFLIRLFYYYPLINIEDGNGWSYTSGLSIIKLHNGSKLNKVLYYRVNYLKQHDIENNILYL